MIADRGISCEIALRLMPLELSFVWQEYIGLVSGLVPSGNKPLPEQMFT